MAYGLKYASDFDSAGASYTLEIYQKDYIFPGYETEVTAGASAVVHSWDTDDPKAPIKGSSIIMNLINEAGNIPLADLYSSDDEEFKAKLIWHSVTDVTLFEGFIVQDDSSELMVDYNHEISLSANDNLGLLKDIPFNEAFYQEYLTFATEEDVPLEGIAPHTLIIDSVVVLLPGDVISITGTLSGVYHVTGVSGNNITVIENIATTPEEEVATMIVFRGDFYTLRTLNSFIKTCLLNTGLTLNTAEFTNLNEITQDDTGCFLDQTLLDPQTFNNGSQWDDCYTVLEKILSRFDCTLFQALGRWNIIRWDELRDFNYAVPGFLYNSEMVFQSLIFLDDSGGGFGGWDKFLIGLNENTQAETGLQQRISRPFKFTEETFNYRQPEELLRNGNLQQLGTFRTSYAYLTYTVFEYEFPWWITIPESVVGPSDYCIAVVQDALGNEVDRFIIIKVVGIQAFGVSAATGDRFTFTFTFLTPDSQPGNLNLNFGIKIYDGVQTDWMDESGDWVGTGAAYTYNIPSGDNTNIKHTVEISGTVPYDGLLYFQLIDADQAGTDNGTFYKDLRLEYIPLVNQSTKIIGHTHNSNQELIIKNKSEREIPIDVSPRNSIAGTLFLDSTTGVLQDRATQWKRKPRVEEKNLGEITTSENLFLRRVSRTLLEGSFYGLLSVEQEKDYEFQPNHLSLLSVCRYTYFPIHNFIFGRLEIDYSENFASGTMYEMYKDNEADNDLDYVYLFTFLYDTK